MDVEKNSKTMSTELNLPLGRWRSGDKEISEELGTGCGAVLVETPKKADNRSCHKEKNTTE